MVPRLYEVLIHAEMPSRIGAKGRWYLGAAHPDLAGAEAAFRAFDHDFPSARVTLALIRSEHDPATGLFVDRIVKARGRVPMIRRAAMERLDPARRDAVAALDEPDASPSLTVLAAALPARTALSPWMWLAFVAATVAVFAAITAAG